LFRPAESILLVLIIWILLEKHSNFVQQTPPKNSAGFPAGFFVIVASRLRGLPMDLNAGAMFGEFC